MTSRIPSTAPQFSEDERALMVAILQADDVQHASLFGSYARGGHQAESDIDLVVEFPPGASLFDVSALGLAREDALGRPVDLVTSLDRLHPLMREHVLRDQVMLL